MFKQRYDRNLSEYKVHSQKFAKKFINYFFITMTQYRFFDDNDYELMFPTFIRGVSDDNCLVNFFCPKQQSVEPLQKQPITNQENTKMPVPQFNKYIKAKEQKKKTVTKQKKDYKKNICGYITKKIVRQFMDPQYKQKVLELCIKYDCDYQQCIQYYDKKIQRITGPTHLDMLLSISKQYSNMKKCFKDFFIWFLRHRYLRYLISQGKMERKQIYIDYKNKTLLYLGSADQNFQYNVTFSESQSKQTSSLYDQ